MLIILPLTTLIVLFIFFAQNYPWRKAILSAAIVWGVFIVATTELLSLFRGFSVVSLTILWSIFELLTIALVLVNNRQKAKQALSQRNSYSLNTFESLVKEAKGRWFLAVLLLAIVSIITLVGVIAIVAPPNTWDSMTYHMSRVVHWIQNGSVAFYPTYNLPQLFHPPFAEYAIAHLQILSGTDRYANLIQWLAMIGSAIAVSAIAQELKADGKGQVFAAVFAVTIPMGILQASSTQNDYAVSFYILCLAYFVLLSINNGAKQTSYFFIGASLGLAILTKSSGYLYCFAFMVWYSLVQLKRWGLRAWIAVFIPSAIALLINLNHYLRNYSLFNTFIGAPENFASAYKIEVFSIPVFISNLLRNLALHADIVRNLNLENYIDPTTGIVNKVLVIIHDWLNIDMFDPRTTAGSYRGVPGISFNENIAGNPLHFVFILLALLLLILFRKKLKNKLVWTYIFASITGFIFICLLLKIQIYQSRHHLALFLLLSSVVGIALSKIPIKLIANSLIILIIVASFPWVLYNEFRPIVGEKNIFNTPRITQYFVNRSHLEQPYIEATQFVTDSGCNDVGLSLGRGITVGNEYWEYPLWVLLKEQNSQIKIHHIQPENVSNTVADRNSHKNFDPCAIIAIRQKPELPVSQIEFKDQLYIEKLQKKPVNVLTD